jgi:hypothetical protein
LYQCCGSASFDADPDPTFYFDAYPAPDSTPSFTLAGKSKFFFFYSQQCKVTLFFSRHWCNNFHYFGKHLEIFWKKYSSALHQAKMDTDPDWQAQDSDLDSDPPKLCQSNRIRNNEKYTICKYR